MLGKGFTLYEYMRLAKQSDAADEATKV
jgi:hypothetical protein